MNTMLAKSFKLNKSEKTVLIGLFVLIGTIVAVGNIYWVCNKFGITLAPGWYQDIIDFVSSGGTIVEAFAFVAGVTLPAWVGPILLAFGTVSA